MKIKSWLTLIAFTTVIFLFVGSFRAVKSEIRIVSDSEFEEILGHNAAVKQFGDNSMLIETRKIKVNKFLKKEMPEQTVDENKHDDCAPNKCGATNDSVSGACSNCCNAARQCLESSEQALC